MKMTIHLTDPEDSVTCELNAWDRMEFERIGRQAIGIPQTTKLAEAVAISPESFSLWLAWHALKDDGVDVGSWQDFRKRIADYTQTGEPELPDPTKAGQSPA